MIPFQRFLKTCADIGRLRRLLPFLIVAAGVLYVLDEIAQYVRTPYPWPHLVLRLLLACFVCGIAIAVTLYWLNHLAQVESEADQKLKAMEALHEISLGFVSQLDAGRVTQLIAQRSAELLDAEAGYLHIFSPEEQLLTITAQWGGSRYVVGEKLRYGEGIGGAVIEAGRPLLVNDYQHWDKRVNTFDSENRFDATVGVPLQWEGQIIGSMTIADCTGKRRFTDFDAWLLRPFADLASIALSNAKLYGKWKALSAELALRDAAKTKKLTATEDELCEKAVHLQGLIKRMTELQESERARVSRDMHDSTTQLILGAVYATQAALDALRTNPDSAREHMQMVQQFLRQIEAEIREAIANLRPLALDDRGIVHALRQHVERFKALTGLECEVQVSGDPRRCSDQVETTAFRVVQEGMQNAAAHARPSHIGICVDFAKDYMRITIADDGVGFTPSGDFLRSTKGFGLIGMQERAQAIGATLDVISQPGSGTRLVLDIPLDAMPEADPAEVAQWET